VELHTSHPREKFARDSSEELQQYKETPNRGCSEEHQKQNAFRKKRERRVGIDRKSSSIRNTPPERKGARRNGRKMERGTSQGHDISLGLQKEEGAKGNPCFISVVLLSGELREEITPVNV